MTKLSIALLLAISSLFYATPLCYETPLLVSTVLNGLPDNPPSHLKKVLFGVPNKYKATLIAICEKYQVPASILAGVIFAESNWSPNIINKNKNGTIDIGLAQLNSRYLHEFAMKDNNGIKINPNDPLVSLSVAASYLSRLYKMHGTWQLAVAAYNCGPGNVARGTIPASTTKYVEKIMNFVLTSADKKLCTCFEGLYAT